MSSQNNLPLLDEVQNSKKRIEIRSSKIYAESISNFEEAARIELTEIAGNILSQVTQLSDGISPQDLDVEELLNVIGTNAFRDFSLALEDADLENHRSAYYQELQQLPDSERDLYANVIEERLQIVGYRWAIYIHGSVQTRLSAAALMIREANNRVDFQGIHSAIELLREILENPASQFTTPIRSLAKEIEARLSPWEGLLNIELHLDSNLESIPSPRNADIGEIVGEIISNAVRHGEARNLTLEILPTSQQNEIVVRVSDDATIPPPAAVSHAGLGTKIFNSVSDGRWYIKRDELKAKTIFNILVSTAGELQ